jgi:hypothetical protein
MIVFKTQMLKVEADPVLHRYSSKSERESPDCRIMDINVPIRNSE